MSRAIDWTQPLSDEDRAHAMQFSINHERVRLNDEMFAGNAEASESLDGDDVDDVKPYPEWTKDELSAEATKRGLTAPAKAKKEDLVALLEADDDAADV
jgi:hypothetical protein